MDGCRKISTGIYIHAHECHAAEQFYSAAPDSLPALRPVAQGALRRIRKTAEQPFQGATAVWKREIRGDILSLFVLQIYGSQTLIGYDSRGNKTVTVDAKGNSVLQIFDGASRPLESQQLMRQNGLGNQGPAANSTFLSAGRSLIRTQTLFDGNSRMFQMIDDGGATTDYSFDTLDRQVSMEFADGSTRITPRDLASDVITYTDENGSVFANTWDCMGRKTDIAIAAASGIGGTRW